MNGLDYIRDLVDIYQDELEIVDSEDKVKQAIKIFGWIKKNQKQCGELASAKSDLDYFGIDYKGLSKNQIYLKQQSEMVNRIVMVLNENMI